MNKGRFILVTAAVVTAAAVPTYLVGTVDHRFTLPVATILVCAIILPFRKKLMTYVGM